MFNRSASFLFFFSLYLFSTLEKATSRTLDPGHFRFFNFYELHPSFEVAWKCWGKCTKNPTSLSWFFPVLPMKQCYIIRLSAFSSYSCSWFGEQAKPNAATLLCCFRLWLGGETMLDTPTCFIILDHDENGARREPFSLGLLFTCTSAKSSLHFFPQFF